MKLQINNISNWIKIGGFTSIVQLLIQIIGVLSGIIIIRLLPTNEYAYYTIANTILGTMTALGDGGLSTGLMAIGGKVWSSRKGLGEVLKTALIMRQKFAVISFIVVFPFLVYLLASNGASFSIILLISIMLIPTFYAQLTDSLLQVIPKLHQDIYSLQKNTLYVNIGRLCMMPILFVGPFSYIALLVTAIPRVIGNFRLRKIALKFVDSGSSFSNEIRDKIFAIVKRVLPGNIYNAVSSNIIVFIMSIFGSTSNVAEVGALSRLVVIFTVLSMVLNILVVPRYAKIPDNRDLLEKYLWLFVSFIVGISAIVLTFVYFFPEPVLWVLGAKYAGLQQELFLIMLGAALSMLSGSLYGIMSNRGIIPNPYYFFPFILVVQVITLAFLNLSDLIEVLYFGIIPPIAGIVYRLIYFKKVLNHI